jgi:quercetin dioxygenase-like cupin family protein
MLVKHAIEVESKNVPNGKDAIVQVLISAQEGPNFAMRRYHVKKGGSIPRHMNAVEHEQYILQGHAMVGIGDEVFEVKAGDVLLIPAGQPHYYRNMGDESFEFLCVIPNKEDIITLVSNAGC